MKPMKPKGDQRSWAKKKLPRPTTLPKQRELHGTEKPAVYVKHLNQVKECRQRNARGKANTSYKQ